MKQFILASNAAYATAVPTDTAPLAAGQVGFMYLDNGELKVATKPIPSINMYQLMCGANAVNVQPYNIPIHSNNFSYVKGVYQAATTFSATVDIPTIPTANGFAVPGDYSVVITKKGKKFNERHNWTATAHIGRNSSLKDTDVANAIAKWINSNPNCGVTATVATAKITITAVNTGEDFEVSAGDDLFSIIDSSKVKNTHAAPAYGDAAYVTDLANKDAADHGIEYTFRDAYMELYPNYPVNPLAKPNGADTGFTIFTLRFAEPRAVKTRDDVVNQLVQVAFPSGNSAAITAFETFCKALAEKDYNSGVNDTTNNTDDNPAPTA